jgi:uncharacterized protein with beta-barrel porin domain
MFLKSLRILRFSFLLFLASKAHAVTLTSGQTDYVTTEDITTSASGIITSLSGSSGNLNSITNLHIITTGDSGSTSSAYGIRSSGDYYQIINDSSGSIITTGSSGRGISISDYSTVTNSGNISTQGSTSYGIYSGGDGNEILNSGSISTIGTTSYGIYLNGDDNAATNSGSISTLVYGIYSAGNTSQISNSGTITTTSGSSAHGIFVSAGSSSTASSSSYSTIDNSGTISANANGIYAKDDYTQITNSGTITSGSGSSNYGIRVDGDYSEITNSGEINSTNYAIYNSGSNTIINNSGNISGGILLGEGALNISGGTISGKVDGSGSGNVNVISNFTQSAAFTNLNSLNINSSSTLTSNSDISANNITIESGSILTIASGSSVSGTIQGLSNSSGTLDINGDDFSLSGSIGVSGNSLANLNIKSGSSLATSSDIYADNIYLEGILNFYDSENLTITGNVAGSGSGSINVGTNSQNISGNLTLNSGDSFAASLGNGIVGNLTVDGIATIDSAAKLEITPTSTQGYIADGTEFTLISGNSDSKINAISDDNISVDGANNINGLLRFSTSATSNSLILNINRLAASEVTTNKNAQKIYQNLNEIGANSSGNLSDFQDYIDNSGFTGEALSDALNQASPQSSKANLAVTKDNALNSLMASEARLDKLRKDLHAGAWVQAIGSSASQKDVKDDYGFKANSMGIAIGADQDSGSDNIIGASFAFSRSNVKSLDSLKTSLISSGQLNFYSGQNFGDYFFDSLAGFSWNSFSSNRAITALDLNATSRYSGQTYLAKFKIGKTKKLKYGFILTPEFSLNFLHNKVGGYSEAGAKELNLKVGAISANFLESRIGANLGFEAKVKKYPPFKKVASNLKISYGQAFINSAPTTVSSFEGQSQSFNSEISDLDSNSLKIGTAFSAYSSDFTSFVIDYNFEKRATYSSHFIAARIRQEF